MQCTLHCTALQCTHSTETQCNALHCNAMQCTPLYCTALRSTAFHTVYDCLWDCTYTGMQWLHGHARTASGGCTHMHGQAVMAARACSEDCSHMHGRAVEDARAFTGEYSEYSKYSEYSEYREYREYREYSEYSECSECSECGEYCEYSEYSAYTEYSGCSEDGAAHVRGRGRILCTRRTPLPVHGDAAAATVTAWGGVRCLCTGTRPQPLPLRGRRPLPVHGEKAAVCARGRGRSHCLCMGGLTACTWGRGGSGTAGALAGPARTPGPCTDHGP
jgi:hypothetical protein